MREHVGIDVDALERFLVLHGQVLPEDQGSSREPEISAYRLLG